MLLILIKLRVELLRLDSGYFMASILFLELHFLLVDSHQICPLGLGLGLSDLPRFQIRRDLAHLLMKAFMQGVGVGVFGALGDVDLGKCKTHISNKKK